jgi:hypothetical protein
MSHRFIPGKRRWNHLNGWGAGWPDWANYHPVFLIAEVLKHCCSFFRQILSQRTGCVFILTKNRLDYILGNF